MALPRADIAAAAALTSACAALACVLAGLPAWPALLVQLAMLTGAWPDRTGHHGRGVGLANGVTLFRSALVGLLAAWAATASGPQAAMVGVASLAFALDGLDGAIARRTGRSSRLGARLDMELDAVTVVVLGLLSWRQGHAGAWVLVAGAWRYAFVLAASIAPWLRAPLDDFRPRRWACGAAVTALIAAVALTPPAGSLAAALGVGITSMSFLRDIGWLWRRRREPDLAGAASS